MTISNIFYLIMFLIYILIPLLIIFDIFSTTNEDMKKYKFKHAIISIVTTVINVIALIYILVVGTIKLFYESKFFFLIPALLLLASIISYKSGKKGERTYEAEIASKEIDDVRSSRREVRQTFTVSFNEEDEKL